MSLCMQPCDPFELGNQKLRAIIAGQEAEIEKVRKEYAELKSLATALEKSDREMILNLEERLQSQLHWINAPIGEKDWPRLSDVAVFETESGFDGGRVYSVSGEHFELVTTRYRWEEILRMAVFRQPEGSPKV